MMVLPDWFPRWPGETCVVVAAGPSAKGVPLNKGLGLVRYIAVNRSIELCPWADVWYACDFNFWHKHNGGVDFIGKKLSIDARACATWPIHHIDCRKVTDVPNFAQVNTVGWGGNSGFHALQIAIKAGCKKVILVGLDASVEHGLHWHGAHPEGMANPRAGTVTRWQRAIDGAAPQIRELGVKVINCSAISALRAYPKMLFEEALAA